MTFRQILDEVIDKITGAVTNLRTTAKNLLVNAINELNDKFVYGDENQILVTKSNNSNVYKFINPLEIGNFVTSDDELNAAKLIYVNQATIFSTWKRYSHGVNTAGIGNPVPSNILPGTPDETNSWSFNSGTNQISSTLNSASFISFVSPEKYSKYTHKATIGASGSDNDYIAIVIAAMEDTNDMVTNSAYGLNPSDFSWPIDVTSPTVPNQHTLSVIRGRTTQANFPFSSSTRYAIVYDLGKLTEQVIVNGENLVGLVNSTIDYGAGAECDVQVIRDGDLIDVDTTNWSDGAGGKGTLGNRLSYNLALLEITNKFRGAASYGYGALSQQNATFKNISINPNRNSLYDVRNGDVWVADSEGNYSIDNTVSLYSEFGVRRWFYNPTTFSLIHVNADKTFEVIGGATVGGGGRFGIEDITSGDVDRSIDMENHYLTIDNLNGIALTSWADPFAEDKFNTSAQASINLSVGQQSTLYALVPSLTDYGYVASASANTTGNDPFDETVTPSNLGTFAQLQSASTGLEHSIEVYSGGILIRAANPSGIVNLMMPRLPVYSNNADALADLGMNKVYRNGDDLKITH